MGFSRQAYWSGLPFPSPGELPDPGIEPGSPALHAGALPSEPETQTLYLILGWLCTQERLHPHLFMAQTSTSAPFIASPFETSLKRGKKDINFSPSFLLLLHFNFL